MEEIQGSTQQVPRVLQAIAAEAQSQIQRPVSWRGDWKKDSYPRYSKHHRDPNPIEA